MLRQQVLNNKKINGGYILLMAIIIIGGAGFSISLSLLVLSTGTVKNSSLVEASGKAKAAASACSENALLGIKNDSEYTAGDNMSLNGSTCSVVAVTTNNETYTIHSQGQSLDSYQRLIIIADRDSDSGNMTVGSWTEVAEF